jgi:hypothetical protein
MRQAQRRRARNRGPRTRLTTFAHDLDPWLWGARAASHEAEQHKCANARPKGQVSAAPHFPSATSTSAWLHGPQTGRSPHHPPPVIHGDECCQAQGHKAAPGPGQALQVPPLGPRASTGERSPRTAKRGRRRRSRGRHALWRRITPGCGEWRVLASSILGLGRV